MYSVSLFQTAELHRHDCQRLLVQIDEYRTDLNYIYISNDCA